ncbi:MAG: PAS domain S-box protein [Chloroflexi bacterium]|nr:PAS domain S-box protein [Chloroflexota bacterium]
MTANFRLSEDNYRYLFDNASDAMWVHDMDGNLMVVNKACEKLTGYALQELIGMKVSKFLAEEYLHKAQGIKRKLLAGEPIAQPYEQRLIRKDGTMAIMKISTSLFVSHGEVIGMQNIARDITEEKRLQRNLQSYADIDKVAVATLRIEFGTNRGSGFHFLNVQTVLTNHHVVEGAEYAKAPAIIGVTESGSQTKLELVAWSPKTKHDFAILRAVSPVPEGRNALQPKVMRPIARGTEVFFGGFPHGIPHLLVQRAFVAGLVSPEVFYLDGSVNGGNSGGPIVDAADGTVIGLVTQRRFLGGADLEDIAKSAEQLRTHCQAIAGRGSVQIMGIDFSGFIHSMAESRLIVRRPIEANANTGIGIGFSIAFASSECASRNIS